MAIYYETSPESSALQWLPKECTAGKKLPYLFSQCQAIHARALIPCQDTPAAKFTYDAAITVPEWATALMSAVSAGSKRKGAPGAERRVLLDVKADIEAKDYSEVIRKEHLRPLELEFFKAEDALKQVAREFNYMRKREARMRETSESTGGRIKMFGYVSISVLLLLSFWQTVYLKSFFRSKKLL